MTESRRLLQHFLAALAYRTQKALRDASLHGGEFAPPRVDTFSAEIDRFHSLLNALSRDFAEPALEARITDDLRGQRRQPTARV